MDESEDNAFLKPLEGSGSETESSLTMLTAAASNDVKSYINLGLLRDMSDTLTVSDPTKIKVDGDVTSSKIIQEHIYYNCFTRLLLQAGTDLLREITDTALKKKGQTLFQFLNSVRPALLNDRHLTKGEKDTLYPENPQVASINDFDITLLSYLLSHYLYQFIDTNEIKGVYEIRDLRNKHVHRIESKMDVATFTREWNQLATVIKDTGKGLPFDVQQRLRYTVASIENEQLIVDDIGNIDKGLLSDVQQSFKKHHDAIDEHLKTIDHNTVKETEKIIIQESEVAIADAHPDGSHLISQRLLFVFEKRCESHV